MTPREPQFASDYDDRTTAAVKAVLIEIGQILGSFKGKFAVVGGAVPWLLLGNDEDMPHVGTLDVDLGLDAEALGDGEYAMLAEVLLAQGYAQRKALRRFQLVRQVPAVDGCALLPDGCDRRSDATASVTIRVARKRLPKLAGPCLSMPVVWPAIDSSQASSIR